MPLKMYNKPRRSKPRYFTACDAARIARQVVDDLGQTPEEVLACIAKGFGFTHISLSRQTVVESNIGTAGISLAKVVLTKGLPLLEKLLEKLPGGLARWGTIIAAIKKLIDFANKADTLEPPQAPVDDIIDKEKCNCKKQ